MRQVHVYTYELDLTREFTFNHETMKKRKGFVIELIDEESNKGYGEIAPLPGISRESPEDIIHELKTIAQLFVKEDQFPLQTASFPSALFGLEFALAQFAPAHPPKPLPIAALLWEDPLIYAKKAYEKGCRTFKVKITQCTLKEAIALVKELKTNYPDVLLRIDSNQKWSLTDAIFFSSHFTPDDFAYLEEPIASFADLCTFSELTSFPIGIDEFLYTLPLEDILAIPTLKALVIKPTLLGGLKECKDLQHELRKHPVDFVLSPSFESGLGTLAIARLGQLLHLKTAVGVDTYRFLQEDILTAPLSFDAGCITYEAPMVNKEKLCRIFSVP